jgi:signal transduction histidine kinase
MVVAVAAAVLSLSMAGLSRRLSIAPGWTDQRWFSYVATTACLYSVIDAVMLVCDGPAAIVACAQLQLALSAAHVFCWSRYADTTVGAGPRPLRWVCTFAVCLAAVGFVPGAVFLGVVRAREVAALGVIYHEPSMTRLGEAAYAVVLGAFWVIPLRFAMACRRRTPHAGMHLAATLILAACATYDAVGSSAGLPGVYVVNLGFVLSIGGVEYVRTSRFVEDAHALRDLRCRLEKLVEARTAELAQAQAALHCTEKLAALGQFAAGVAHEVNNPAAVASSNLRYLRERLARGVVPDDALESVRDCDEALGRITTFVRQLLDAGCLAGSRVETRSFPVAHAVRESLRLARPRCGREVTLVDAVPPSLAALGQEQILVQVLFNLVVNAGQAIPPGRAGEIAVTAQDATDRVRITVEDDGDGIAPDVLARVFEPFFTTKPVGAGTGLGLAISRGLVESLGGTLRLASVVGHGTRAIVELPAAPATEDAARTAPPGRRPPARDVEDRVA